MNMFKIGLISVCLLFGLTLAQETDGFVEEDAHEHGVALVNIAQEANALFIEFVSPSINIVGFEYQPSSDEEKELVEAALSNLADGMMLFSPTDAANCTLMSADVDSEIAEEHESGEHHEEHSDGEHGDEEDGDEKHDNKEHDNEEHAEDEHEDEHHEEGEEHEDEHEHEDTETHSEFHASYEFSCDQPDQLAGLDLEGLFSLYPSIVDLDVQYALERGQGAAELSPESTGIDF